MSKLSLIPGTIAINENGEIGVIQSRGASNYTGINLSRQVSVTRPGFDGEAYRYQAGAEWTSVNPELICHTDDLLLLGQRMYDGQNVPFEIPSTKHMGRHIAMCTVDILGFVTSDERCYTDMGDNRWPGYHLNSGEYLNKAFEGETIDYIYKANNQWSSSKPRPVVKLTDLVAMGHELREWAKNAANELVTA
jgi:hypothetical protein